MNTIEDPEKHQQEASEKQQAPEEQQPKPRIILD